MTINTWYEPKENLYHVYYDGKHYTRRSYIAVKELIESLLANLVLKTRGAK